VYTNVAPGATLSSLSATYADNGKIITFDPN